jgi:hypothetical protein
MASLTERSDGFVPIESYGVIGDGKSAALVACDGAVDWWAAPAMDSTPVFAAVLDPAAGSSFTLEPAVPYAASRRYLPGTNVLETTFATGDGTVRVVDSMNQGANGPLPWAELAREVQPVSGRVPMRWQVAVGTMFHQGCPWVRLCEVPLVHAGKPAHRAAGRRSRPGQARTGLVSRGIRRPARNGCAVRPGRGGERPGGAAVRGRCPPART